VTFFVRNVIKFLTRNSVPGSSEMESGTGIAFFKYMYTS